MHDVDNHWNNLGHKFHAFLFFLILQEFYFNFCQGHIMTLEQNHLVDNHSSCESNKW
jgi:hypothetical protein